MSPRRLVENPAAADRTPAHEDFWRNKARIEHLAFVIEPSLEQGRLVFATRNRLVAANGMTLATLISRFGIGLLGDHAFELTWDSDIRGEGRELVFGDQEEMGLGVRVATELTELKGGLVVNSDGVTGAPTHSYMKYLFKYQQARYPYEGVVDTNRAQPARARVRVIETGVFDEGRYFDVFVEYAKGGPEDVLMRVTAFNRGPEAARLHILPTICNPSAQGVGGRLLLSPVSRAKLTRMLERMPTRPSS